MFNSYVNLPEGNNSNKHGKMRNMLTRNMETNIGKIIAIMGK